MNDGKLKLLLDETLALDREVRRLQEKLKANKAALAGEAATRDAEQVDTDGGGWSWTMPASDGSICRVTMPGPVLKAEVDGEGRTIEKIRDAAGAHFARLFLQAPKYKLIRGFREEALGLLGRSAGKLIKLCTTSGSPKVSFETKPEES